MLRWLGHIWLTLSLEHIWVGTYLGRDMFGHHYLCLMLGHIWDVWVGTYLGRDMFGDHYLCLVLGHIWVGTYLVIITSNLYWDIFGSGHNWVRDINGSRT